MELRLGQRRVRIRDADLLGEGGEARVFRFGDLALKVFHAVAPGDAVGARVRAQKLEKLSRLPALGPFVLTPLELIRSSRGDLVGYSMKAVSGAESFDRLAQRRWRDQLFSSQRVMEVFRHLHDLVRGVHARGVVVGDFNDGNVLLAQDQSWLIDTDSMELPGLPCVVAHERFLDPRLYGKDLAAGACFSVDSDWYAFAVMLFSSLLYVHPFGGTHPKLGTLLRRAEARHSVLRPDVTLPRSAASPDVLPDDALHWFHGVFENDRRGPPPPQVLALTWQRCRCGMEHSQAQCPGCRHQAASPRAVVRSRGRCVARVAFQTPGRVLCAVLQGGLRYAFQEDGAVLREDRSLVTTVPLTPGFRLALSGSITWLADDCGRLQRIEGGQVTERAQTELCGASPVLCAASSVSYRQEREWLVEQVTGRRVGQVLEGQTWLWTGERLGLGFYRAGGLTVAFLLRSGRAGLTQLSGVSWAGRVVSAEAVFDSHHGLLSVLSEVDGRQQMHRWLFSETGELRAELHGGALGHAAVLGGRVVVGTDAGLVALAVDGGRLLESTLFADTQPFISAGDELLPCTDGSLMVVGTRDIVQLTLT